MKGKLPIIVAIILGVVAVLGIRSYVQRIQDDAAQQLQGRQVLYAATDIAKGAELSEQMMTTDTVPDRFIPRQAITSSAEKRQVVGRKTRVPIPQGSIILWSDLQVEKRGGLSSLIPEGERAFTVDLTLGVNIDLLQLNDRVDIIGIFDEPKDSGSRAARSAGAAGLDANRSACVVLLQCVNIMAIGTTIGENYGMPGDQGSGSVTFSVTLPEAQMLMFASNNGELALVLRREGEVEILTREDLPRITVETLNDRISELDGERTTRVIQVMKGGKVQEIEIEVESGTGLQTFE